MGESFAFLLENQVQALLKTISDGDDHPAAFVELVEELLGNLGCGGGDQDDLVRCSGRVTLAAVGPYHLDAGVA